jgi:hypothetical protein
MTFDKSKLGFFKKFAQGSENVSSNEIKKTIIVTSLAAIISAILLRKFPFARNIFKKTLIVAFFIASSLVSFGGFTLILKYRKALL